MDGKTFKDKVLGRTPQGKQVALVPIKNSRLFKIEFRPGGELPKELRGSWSDQVAAKRAVDNYFTRTKRILKTNLSEVNI